MVRDVLSFAEMNASTDRVEWLGDSVAARHIRNDLSLMWYTRVAEDDLVLGQVSSVLKIHTQRLSATI